MNIQAHTSFIGTTGYANHAQSFFTELDKFRTTPVDELKQWFTEQIPKLKHNQELFLEYGRKSTTKVKLLERLRNG